MRWLVGLVLLVLFLLHWAFFENTLYWYYADLWETLGTYARFGSVTNVEFRYPQQTTPSTANNSLVPKILHHIWLQEDKDIEMHDTARETCVKMHKSEEG